MSQKQPQLSTSDRGAGWIKLHRKFFSNPIWQESREFSKAEAWLDILREAQHSETPEFVIIGLQRIECCRGQCIKSLDTWAHRWNWSKSKVRRVLNLFQSLSMIRTENVTKTTRITVCNYDTYNPLRNNKDSQAVRKRFASGSHSTPDKKERRKEEEEEEPPLTPPGGTGGDSLPPNDGKKGKPKTQPTKSEVHDKEVGEFLKTANFANETIRELFIEWMDERRKMKKYATTRACAQSARKLASYPPDVQEQALRDSISGSWQGIFPDRCKTPKASFGGNDNSSIYASSKEYQGLHTAVWREWKAKKAAGQTDLTLDDYIEDWKQRNERKPHGISTQAEQDQDQSLQGLW